MLGFGCRDLGFRAYRVQGLGFSIWGWGVLGVWGLGFRV